jgi:NAD+ kinase
MLIDSGTEKAVALRIKFQEFLSPKFRKELENDDNKLTVVFGGDGTLIYKVNKHGLDRTYLPINGGSLGFLMNDANDIVRTAALVEAEAYNVREFITLDAEISSKDMLSFDTAINDVYIERATGQAAKLTISVDERVIVKGMVCDGVIISSPLGSTGYNKSAGGAVCLPVARVLQITPICAHSPTPPPIIVPATSTIKVCTLEEDKRPIRVVADGRSHLGLNAVTVRTSNEALKLAYFKGNDFTDRLINKVLRRR